MLVPINITGGTYKHKSLPLSAQVTRNFWPQKQQEGGTRSEYVLESFPGLTLLQTVSGGVDRGMVVHNGTFYRVVGSTLYSVSSAMVHTSLGTIAGSARCIFAGIGTGIVIVSAGTVYYWNGVTLATVSDIDLESPNAAAHLNNQIIYDGTDARFCVSDVGDPTAINGLNYAAAEAEADTLIRPYSFEQVIYMMCARHIERWWNSGTGNPPFDRIEQSVIPVGLAALHSVANNDNFMYFLGDDNQVYAIKGAQAQVVSPQPLNREIANYDIVEDAIGWCMNIQGQQFYVLTFPDAQKTWLYPEGGEWFEWSSGEIRSRANSYVYFNRKHIVADYANGNLYELDEAAYSDNGTEIIRVRHSAPLHGGDIGAAGKPVEMTRFELIMETGVGLVSGQGDEPEVMLRFSDDGGRTFGTEMRGTVGQLGQFLWKVEWFALGRFDSRILAISTSDPVHICIYSAVAEVEACI